MMITRRAGILAGLVVLVLLALTQVAQAATTISRAELSGTQVRIEGSGATPNARLIVNGGTLTGTTADSGGNFRIENNNFATPADCKVTVSDGSTSATRTLSGCTVSQPPSSSSTSLSALSLIFMSTLVTRDNVKDYKGWSAPR